MGALIGVVGKKGTNVSNLAVTLLETLSHRGSEASGIASPSKAVIRNSLKKLREEDLETNALIGCNFAKISPQDGTRLIQNSRSTVVFDGRLFDAGKESEAEIMLKKLSNAKDVTKFIRVFNGDYALAVAHEGGIVVGRDAIGACPLYFGENEDLCAVASERKALWKMGLTMANSFRPGRVADVTEEGFRFRTAKTIGRPPLQTVTMETAAHQLEQVLLQSTSERVSDVEEVAIAFSGGLDSGLIAFLTKLCNAEAHLIYVELESQGETSFAERAAEALGFPLHVTTYSVDELEECLPMVAWLIEEPSPLQLSIATPMFWTAEHSAKLGLHVLLAGQGGDELFGGYHRYLEDYEKRGQTGLQRKLYHDVVSSYESNFQRDNKVCAFHKVELRLPFADWETIQLSLSIASDLKISSPQDALRKRVLRRTARKMGIPKFIAEKPKKAIQYTTGVNQAMKKIAKKEGLTLQKYVENIYSKAYKMLE